MINKARILLILSSLIIVLSGYSMTPERKPIPVDLVKQAAIPSIPDARFWADEWPAFSVHKFENLTDKELCEHFSAIYNTEHNYLAISGGVLMVPLVPDYWQAGQNMAIGLSLPWLLGAVPVL